MSFKNLKICCQIDKSWNKENLKATKIGKSLSSRELDNSLIDFTEAMREKQVKTKWKFDLQLRHVNIFFFLSNDANVANEEWEPFPRCPRAFSSLFMRQLLTLLQA